MRYLKTSGASVLISALVLAPFPLQSFYYRCWSVCSGSRFAFNFFSLLLLFATFLFLALLLRLKGRINSWQLILSTIVFTAIASILLYWLLEAFYFYSRGFPFPTGPQIAEGVLWRLVEWLLVPMIFTQGWLFGVVCGIVASVVFQRTKSRS